MLFIYCTPRPDNEVIMNGNLLVGSYTDSERICAWKCQYICNHFQVVRNEIRRFEDTNYFRSAFSNNTNKNFLRIYFLFGLDQMELDLQINYLIKSDRREPDVF
jgi:hypothetical protein